jgi:hypothetical protein
MELFHLIGGSRREMEAAWRFMGSGGSAGDNRLSGIAKTNLAHSQSEYFMRQQSLRSLHEPNRVWKLRVTLKGSLVCPLGMNREQPGFTDGLKRTDRETTALSLRLADHP